MCDRGESSAEEKREALRMLEDAAGIVRRVLGASSPRRAFTQGKLSFAEGSSRGIIKQPPYSRLAPRAAHEARDAVALRLARDRVRMEDHRSFFSIDAGSP